MNLITVSPYENRWWRKTDVRAWLWDAAASGGIGGLWFGVGGVVWARGRFWWGSAAPSWSLGVVGPGGVVRI